MTQVKERPILFSGPMVRAILAGRKTQTRRVVKLKAHDGFEVGPNYEGEHWPVSGAARMKCPYGKPGDRLWVRETTWHRKEDGITTYADASFRTHPTAIIGSKYFQENGIADWPKVAKSFGFKAVPSIHMPRWASRITLEITNVRVERLNEISEADAVAEGVDSLCGFDPAFGAIVDFQKLWESINGPDSWAANPWVWVVEFRRVKP